MSALHCLACSFGSGPLRMPPPPPPPPPLEAPEPPPPPPNIRDQADMPELVLRLATTALAKLRLRAFLGPGTLGGKIKENKDIPGRQSPIPWRATMLLLELPVLPVDAPDAGAPAGLLAPPYEEALVLTVTTELATGDAEPEVCATQLWPLNSHPLASAPPRTSARFLRRIAVGCPGDAWERERTHRTLLFTSRRRRAPQRARRPTRRRRRIRYRILWAIATLTVFSSWTS